MLNWDITRIESHRPFRFQNAGWTLDAYPDLPTLDAGTAMTVAECEGPGVITRIHTTQHHLERDKAIEAGFPEEQHRALVSRGIVFEVYYDGQETPAVRVPLADFFLDGCGGIAAPFSTPYLEKTPGSYNAFIPMPFKKHARVVLRNDTPIDLMNYSFVEWRPLDTWDDRTGYFHATWQREAFQLTGDTDKHLFHVDGEGHLLGRSLSIATDEELFGEFCFVMEGNNEFRIDGAAEPQVDYLGTEDAFGMSWGWSQPFIGLRHGATVMQPFEPSLLATYSLRRENVLAFQKCLDLRIDWTHEFPGNTPFFEGMAKRLDAGGCWVDYAHGYYWYAKEPGYAHAPLPPLAERIATVLRNNPVEPHVVPKK